MADKALRGLVQASFSRIIGFGQQVLQIPSLSGEEGPLVERVAEEMRALGYDAVEVDGAGNILGRLAGEGGGRHTMLHSHLDIVDPGDRSRWTHDPYGGEVSEGYLWGRGASDTKGSLVAQVYAAGLLREAGLRPAGDVTVAGVVREETGGVGTRYLLQSLVPDVAVIGEPSGNTLRRGHRGRYELIVTLYGRPAHASAPARGLNPHYSMGRFLLALRERELLKEPVFGGSTVVPTLMRVPGTNTNVIPEQVSVTLDWRAAPGDSVEAATTLVREVLAQTMEPGITADVSLASRTLRTWTGQDEAITFTLDGYCLDEDDANLRLAQRSLATALGREVPVDVWTFCTDGGHLAAHGVPCIGFGPGDEAAAHVFDERVAVEELLEATLAYMALALGLSRPV